MNSKEDVKKLSEKFWSGNCSDEEEQVLKEYYSEQSDSGFTSQYLHFIESSQHVALDEAFDIEILNKIDKPERTVHLRKILRVAAAIALLAAVFFMFQRFSSEQMVATNETEFVDTFDNSEEAYQAVKETMMLISTNMNTGKKHTEMISVFHSANARVMGKD